MRKLGVVGFIVAAFWIGNITRPDAAVAQNTKKAAAAGVATGVIEISEGKDEKFRFFVRTDEGKLLAMSQGYASVDDAKTAIQHLKEIVRTAKVAMLKKKTKDEK